ncbi:MAG: choice-of-anchor J domain-containing protein [Prevotella sp.]
MRKLFLLITMALFSLMSVQAQLVKGLKETQKWTLVETDPTNMSPVNPQTALDVFAHEQASKPMPVHRAGFTKAPKREAAESVKYLVAAQSFTKDYTFIFEGGDFSVWDINVAVDGTNVTFEHLFHIEALSPEWNPFVDQVITGVYDAEAKTVSIAAPAGANGTVAATGQSSFITVISGEVNEDAQMKPESNVVFDVLTDANGNITRMTSRYPIALPTYYGTATYGNNAVYRQFIINLPGNDASLLATGPSVEIGECFLGEEASGTLQVINLGGATASFVTDIECDPEGYIISGTPTGEIESGEIKDIVFILKGIAVNDDVEGIATISYEGGNAEDAFDVVLHGKVVRAPDYSPIVKNGDFTFKTNIEGPWEVVTDQEGVQWAMSGARGRKLTSDWNVNFIVPEGQIGTLSWIGKYKNNPAFRYSYYILGGWFIDNSDDADIILRDDNADASAVKEFGPGEHSIRFTHEPMYASGYEEDGLYIRDLNLDLVQPADDAAELKTPIVKFGYYILEEGSGVDGEQTIVIQNRGVNKLTLKSITCDNNEFAAGTDVADAMTLENLVIPVFFSSKVAGNKNATFTVETSAGTFTITATANVISQPDFSQIVAEGAEYMSFTTNPTSPFIVENGIAYNIDCNDEDLVASSQSSMDTGTDLTLNFNIPEGKIGYITWEGKVWGDLEDNTTYSHLNGDFGMFFITQQPFEGYGNMAQRQVFCTDLENGGDASSRQFSEESGWEQFLTYVPGSHTITFRYYHNGDGLTYGKNRMEISNISLHVEDFQDNGAQIMTEGPVEFEPSYAGYNRFTKTNVTLMNTGSKPLKVTGFKADGENSPFVSILPTYEAQFNNTLNVTLVFYPGVHLDEYGNVTSVDEILEDTWFSDKVTIMTTGGDFTLDVSGMAKGSKGILLIGDFEDDCQGWDRIDSDGDGRQWELGTSLWYYENPSYCHSGVQCVGSASNTNYGALTPDNWIVSPKFTVPEDGAMLTWWVASLHNTMCAEHYSVYVEEDFSDVTKLEGMTPVFSETLDEVIPTFQYNERTFDLKDYAGKTVKLAIRHHDCTAQYLLLIDDAFVYTMDKWNVTTHINARQLNKSEVVGREYFNVAGQRVNRPVNGINIVRQIMNDGSVKAVKHIVK